MSAPGHAGGGRPRSTSAARLGSQRALLLAAGIALASLRTQAAEPADDAAARARIAADRAAVEQHFAAAQAACRQRFAVTGCLEAARAERRAALADVQQQQNRLDDARRRDKAAQRLQSIQQRELASRQQGPRPPVAALRPGALPASAMPPPAARSGSAPSADPGADPVAERERQKLAQHQRRLDKARQHQQDLQQRLDRQGARRKPAAGLPLPGASDAPR